jgi:hypothetical protein
VFDLAERALERVRRAPPSPVPEWVAEVHDERGQVISQAPGRGGEPFLIELVD